MAIYPQHSTNPVYASRKEYPDNWCKFFLPGLQRAQPPETSVQVINKVGIAYGHLVDNALVSFHRAASMTDPPPPSHKCISEDFRLFDPASRPSSHDTFLLTAVIYANANECLNDDIYEEDLAEAALVELAAAVAADVLGLGAPRLREERRPRWGAVLKYAMVAVSLAGVAVLGLTAAKSRTGKRIAH